MIHLADMQTSSFLPICQAMNGQDPPAFLVVGKGPSSDRLAAAMLKLQTEYRCVKVLTLNDAAKLVRAPDIAHFIDMEAADRCSGTDAAQVMVPTVMHRNNKPFLNVLDELEKGPSELLPSLVGAADAANRLIVYDKVPVEAGRWHWKSEGVLPVRYFSAEAVFGFLAVMGVKKVYSVGVDGGTGYSTSFAGLQPLTNGRPSFDAQLQPIADILLRFGMEWDKL